MRGCAAPCWPLAALHWVQLVTVGGDDGGFPPPACCSVEALAAALVPVAVDHCADDDEEDAAQHGEEHGEEDADSTHPFVGRAHWRKEENTVTRTQSQWQAGRQAGSAGLTSEQLHVVHAGQGDLLFLLLCLFLLTAQHRQLVELQGDDVVVICAMAETLTSYLRFFFSFFVAVYKYTCICI